VTHLSEPIRDIAHLGRVELFTPQLERSVWYFAEVLGMEVVCAESGSVYLRGYGDYAASTVKLTTAERAGVGCVSWRTVSPHALERRAQAIDRAGLGL